jgi:hypothetical protein
MMAAAKHEMPIGGRRAKMGTGRARGWQVKVWLTPDHARRLDALADAAGVTRTTLIERWIDEHSAPLPEGDAAPE